MRRTTALLSLLLLAALIASPSGAWSEGGTERERDLGPAPSSVYVNYDDEDMNRLLREAQRAAESGDYEKATDRYQAAAERATDHVRRVHPQTFLGIREYVKLRIHSWPAKGIAAYRRITDARAGDLFRTALARGDAAGLQTVARRFAMSSFGSRALLALGTRALARGDEDGALRHYLEVLRLYPEGEIPGVRREDVLAGAALAAAHRSDLLLLEEMRERAKSLPEDAAVTVAGETRLLRAFLDALRPAPAGADAAEGWNTVGGSPSRVGGRSGPTGPLALYWTWVIPGSDMPYQLRSEQRHSPLIPIHPIIADDQVILVGHRSIHALALPRADPRRTRDGIARLRVEELWHFPGGDPEDEWLGHSQADLLPAFASAANGVLVFPFYDTDNVHGRFNDTPEKDAVMSLSLTEQGKLLDQRGGLDPESEGLFDEIAFSGAPLVHDGRAYIAGSRTKHRVETYAFCFDLTRGPGRLSPVWQTKVCLGSSRSQPKWRDWEVAQVRVDASSFAMRHGILYLCSNSGAVAALEAETGEILWVHAYEQAELNPRMFPGELSTLATWFVNPPMLDNRLLYVAPLDSDRLLTYTQRPDIETGHVAHGGFTRRDVLHGFDPEYVLGVREGIVFIAGSSRARGERPLFAVKSAPTSPDDPHRILWRAEIEEDAPRGRGVVAGGAVYFPTEKGIYRVSVVDGKATKIVSPAAPDVISAVNGASLKHVIGNLAVSGPWLVSASEDRVSLFGPPPVAEPVIEKDEGETDD